MRRRARSASGCSRWPSVALTLTSYSRRTTRSGRLWLPWATQVPRFSTSKRGTDSTIRAPRRQAFLYAHHDAGTCAWDHLASARWLLGYPDAALAALREARALADRLNHPMIRTYGTLPTVISLCSRMWVHYYRGDLADARLCADDEVALGTAHGFSGWVDDGAVSSPVSRPAIIRRSEISTSGSVPSASDGLPGATISVSACWRRRRPTKETST
jgi:hypothetical protein